MNCPKCNSPINSGDKFCQVCGNIINNQPQPNVMPSMVTQNQMQQSMNQMGGNPNQFNNMANQPKKNNTIIYLLSGLIVVLIIAVVILLYTSNNKEDKEDKNKDNEVVEKEEDNEEIPPIEDDEEDSEEIPPIEDDEEDDSEEIPPVEDDVEDDDNNLIENDGTTIKGVTFNLPSGYMAMEESGKAAFTDIRSSFLSIVMPMEGNYDLLTVNALKAELEKKGYTNLTSVEKTVNGKKMIVFSLKVSSLNTEIIYVKHSPSVILVASIVYVTAPSTAKQDEIYNILASVEIDSTSLSPNVDIPATNAIQ